MSLNGNLILISELQRHVHYIGKQYPTMNDLTSTGFVVTKMQILTMKDECKYRDNTYSAFQFKLGREQQKVVPWGHVISSLSKEIIGAVAFRLKKIKLKKL